MAQDLLLRLAEDGPWIILAAFLIWKHFSTDSLAIYKSAIAQNRDDSNAIESLAASIESMERSLGTLQNSVHRTEERIEHLFAIKTDSP